VALLLSGCAAVGDSKRSITFDRAARYYENAIRWGDYEAADSIRRQAGPPVAVNPVVLERIKVTGYEVKSNIPSPDHNRINSEVVIHYYSLEHMTEKAVTDHQIWEYDPELQTWFITSPLPAFR
jgi:hypothetical protein